MGIEDLGDREYLKKYAGLADNVATIIHDREELGLTQAQIDAIIRKNLDLVYDILGPGIDQMQQLIADGEWVA